MAGEEKLVVTFHTTSDAMYMETCCKKQGIPGRLIPVPRVITAGCGLAWCLDAALKEELMRFLEDEKIDYDKIRVCIM